MIPLAFLGPWGWAIIALFAIAALLVTIGIFALLRAARFDPASNGDPERDSGLSDLEIKRNAAMVERNGRIKDLRREYLQLDPPPRRICDLRSAICDHPADGLRDLFGTAFFCILILTLLALL